MKLLPPSGVLLVGTMMKERKYIRTVVVALFITMALSSANAQFRYPTAASSEEQPASTLEAMSNRGDNIFSRFFDPAHFNSHQTYTFSFMGGSGGSVGLGVFTNTFNYKASDNLFISADVSAVYSPFSTYGAAFQKSLNGIYLSNARLDWKMGENTFLRVEYSGAPFLNNGYYGDPFSSSNYPFTR